MDSTGTTGERRTVDRDELTAWLYELPRWRRRLGSTLGLVGSNLWTKVEFLDSWVGYLQADGSLSYAGRPAKLEPQLARAVHFRYFKGLSSILAAERLGVRPKAVDQYCDLALTRLLEALQAARFDLGAPYEDCESGLLERRRRADRLADREEDATATENAPATVARPVPRPVFTGELAKLDDKRLAVLAAMGTLPDGVSLQRISSVSGRILDRRDMTLLLMMELVAEVDRSTPPPLGYTLTRKGHQVAETIRSQARHQEVNPRDEAAQAETEGR